jgi:hypothetical protein
MPPGTTRDDPAHVHWVNGGRGATPDHPTPRQIVPILSQPSVGVRTRGSPEMTCPKRPIRTVRLAARDVTVLRSSHPPRAGPLDADRDDDKEPGQEFKLGLKA